MTTDLFWLSDPAWAALEPHLPKNQPGARRVDDRRVISGILHVLKIGCRWRDVPAEYGPAKTIYNRYHRWSQRRIWHRIFEKMAASGPVPQELSIDSTHIKAHRSAQGSKGGFEDLLPPVVAAPTFTVRKPAVAVFTLNDYVAAGIMAEAQAAALREAAGKIADWRFVDRRETKSPFSLVSGPRAGSAAISLSGQFGTVAAVRDLCGNSSLTPARCRLKQELHKRNDGHSHTTGLRRDRSSDTTPFPLVIHGSYDTT